MRDWPLKLIAVGVPVVLCLSAACLLVYAGVI